MYYAIYNSIISWCWFGLQYMYMDIIYSSLGYVFGEQCISNTLMSPSASKVSLAAALRCLMMLIVSVFSKISFSCILRIASAKRNKTLGPSSKKQSQIRRRVWKKNLILNFMKTLWYFECTKTGEVKPLSPPYTGNQHLIIRHLYARNNCYICKNHLVVNVIGCM